MGQQYGVNILWFDAKFSQIIDQLASPPLNAASAAIDQDIHPGLLYQKGVYVDRIRLCDTGVSLDVSAPIFINFG
ncbi:hypothetical protein CSC18_1568 [Klebsiella aerogenes]|nr:hypothetical protein CSC18_1568 [Klebsiella aerogenes]